MTSPDFVPRSGGAPFEDGDDRGRILVFGTDTGGRYSLMEYVVAARSQPTKGVEYGAHLHREIEETFFVRSGVLQFLLGDDVIELRAGDFVRVAPGTRHGFANLSGEPVELLVSFIPGGFEELFIRYRTDQQPQASPSGFIDAAIRDFASEFEG
jgi:mannose-6-phosphate isomerase-like protein (cupin superfamily)